MMSTSGRRRVLRPSWTRSVGGRLSEPWPTGRPRRMPRCSTGIVGPGPRRRRADPRRRRARRGRCGIRDRSSPCRADLLRAPLFLRLTAATPCFRTHCTRLRRRRRRTPTAARATPATVRAASRSRSRSGPPGDSERPTGAVNGAVRRGVQAGQPNEHRPFRRRTAVASGRVQSDVASDEWSPLRRFAPVARH